MLRSGEHGFEVEAGDVERIFELVPFAIPLNLSTIEIAPRAKHTIWIGRHPVEKLGDGNVEIGRFVYGGLVNASELSAELGELGIGNRFDKGLEFAFDLKLMIDHYGSNFDYFPIVMGNSVTAGGFEIDNKISIKGRHSN